ncbi:MAG: FecR domain-containing protein [Elusimicrobia bacterium]|nr:FecR domain-containing protein [Elusimicrobiota bacterium]
MRAANPLLLAALLCSPAAAAPGASLAFVSGRVTVETPSGARAGRTGEPLASGDAVATGADGTAIIATADGSRLKLRAESRIVLTLPAPDSPATVAFLSLGGVFAKVAKRAGQDFRVRTQDAVAAVRGTEFFTAFGRGRGRRRDLWVCVQEGVVAVGSDASARTLRVPAGRGVLLRSGRELTRPQAYDWTKALNWNMDPAAGKVADKTDLDAAYTDLLDQDYR